MTERIGVMGGTFDPIHHGHLVAASEVAARFDLDTVIFVPTGQPWQKAEKKVSLAEDRYLMTVIATASNPRFRVSRVDIDRGGDTYTIDTLADLRKQYPDAELFFITGADALASIVTWRDWDRMFELAQFVGEGDVEDGRVVGAAGDLHATPQQFADGMGFQAVHHAQAYVGRGAHIERDGRICGEAHDEGLVVDGGRAVHDAADAQTIERVGDDLRAAEFAGVGAQQIAALAGGVVEVGESAGAVGALVALQVDADDTGRIEHGAGFGSVERMDETAVNPANDAHMHAGGRGSMNGSDDFRRVGGVTAQDRPHAQRNLDIAHVLGGQMPEAGRGHIGIVSQGVVLEMQHAQHHGAAELVKIGEAEVGMQPVGFGGVGGVVAGNRPGDGTLDVDVSLGFGQRVDKCVEVSHRVRG